MSHGPSTLGIIITSSLSPIVSTSWVMSSSTHGEASSLTRVQRAVSPRSTSRPTLISPSRAATLRSTGTASSRFPRRMSTVGAMSGTLATIFSLEKSRKWIIREGLKGISRTGSGAPMASGLRKSRGLRKGSPDGQFRCGGPSVAGSVSRIGAASAQLPRRGRRGKRPHQASLAAGGSEPAGPRVSRRGRGPGTSARDGRTLGPRLSAGHLEVVDERQFAGDFAAHDRAFRGLSG